MQTKIVHQGKTVGVVFTTTHVCSLGTFSSHYSTVQSLSHGMWLFIETDFFPAASLSPRHLVVIKWIICWYCYFSLDFPVVQRSKILTQHTDLQLKFFPVCDYWICHCWVPHIPNPPFVLGRQQLIKQCFNIPLFYKALSFDPLIQSHEI